MQQTEHKPREPYKAIITFTNGQVREYVYSSSRTDERSFHLFSGQTSALSCKDELIVPFENVQTIECMDNDEA